ncbi:MAG: YcxB family protein [Clostridia bacterium]|nr:YcxB family protein [Clostridia bacterium]
MQVKASSVYDLKACKALNHAIMFGKSDPKTQLITISVLAAAAVLGAAAAMIVFGSDLVLWACITVLVVLYSLFLCIYFMAPRISYKNISRMGGAQNRFVFTDDCLCVSSGSDSFQSSSRMNYSVFLKAMETSDYLFIFQDKMRAIIVDKSTVTDGAPDDIRRALSNTAGLRYIVCNY